MDYRAMFDSKYLGAWHLVDAQGAKSDKTLTIDRVEAQKIIGEGGKQDKKPVIFFARLDVPMICNKVNGKTIAAMYGTDTRNWVGKRITLYSTTTSVGGKEVECIRVRPAIPPEPRKEQERRDAAS